VINKGYDSLEEKEREVSSGSCGFKGSESVYLHVGLFVSLAFYTLNNHAFTHRFVTRVWTR